MKTRTRILTTAAFVMAAAVGSTAQAKADCKLKFNISVWSACYKRSDGTGTITAYTPGADYITFRTQTSAEPVRYYYSKQTTVVDSEGNTVDMSMLRPDMPVRYTYMKDGDRTVISKITLEKPISYYKKETTTTTTTTP